MRYSLLLHNPEPAAGEIDEKVMAQFRAAFQKYAKDLDAAGVLLSADILQPSSVTTTVTLPDLDAALAWAEQCPGAHYGVIEVRPSAIVFMDGQWRQPS
jgi:hypothetical protein